MSLDPLLLMTGEFAHDIPLQQFIGQMLHDSTDSLPCSQAAAYEGELPEAGLERDREHEPQETGHHAGCTEPVGEQENDLNRTLDRRHELIFRGTRLNNPPATVAGVCLFTSFH